VREIRGYKTVETWLTNVKPSTAKPYLHFLNRFCRYAKTDPDTLVEDAKSGTEAVHNTLKADQVECDTALQPA